jgi:hypothetical protein
VECETDIRGDEIRNIGILSTIVLFQRRVDGALQDAIPYATKVDCFCTVARLSFVLLMVRTQSALPIENSGRECGIVGGLGRR